MVLYLFCLLNTLCDTTKGCLPEIMTARFNRTFVDNYLNRKKIVHLYYSLKYIWKEKLFFFTF